MPCTKGKYTPSYDDQFFQDIEKCPKSPPQTYCDCYEQAALQSQIRVTQQQVNRTGNIFQQTQAALLQAARLYPRQTEVQGPPLNVPSRANQKANSFSKIFNPKTRKLLVLLIAGFLIFLAATSYDT